MKSYLPSIKKENLSPSYWFIIAKIENNNDFEINISNFEEKILVNILRYISPRLTASLALGEYINSAIKEL